MSWEITEDEARRLLGLPAGDRAVTFFQLVADWEEAWGLQDADGWVVGKATDALPLWPHSDLAKACARGPWEGAAPVLISLDELVDDLLPVLEEDGLRVAVFPAPDDTGTFMTPADFRERLEAELSIGSERESVDEFLRLMSERRATLEAAEVLLEDLPHQVGRHLGRERPVRAGFPA